MRGLKPINYAVTFLINMKMIESICNHYILKLIIYIHAPCLKVSKISCFLLSLNLYTYCFTILNCCRYYSSDPRTIISKIFRLELHFECRNIRTRTNNITQHKKNKTLHIWRFGYSFRSFSVS